MTINNPGSAFGYGQQPGGETESGGYLVITTVTKGNHVALSATTPTGIIPGLTNGLTALVVGIALEDGAAGATIQVNKGGMVSAVGDATVILTAGHIVLRSATTVGQVISAAASLTFPGANLGTVVVGKTAVAGNVVIHFNQV